MVCNGGLDRGTTGKSIFSVCVCFCVCVRETFGDTFQAQDQLIGDGWCIWGQKLSLIFGSVVTFWVRVRQVLVMIRVRVGFQEMNVCLCHFPKSDLSKFVCVCQWDKVRVNVWPTQGPGSRSCLQSSGYVSSPLLPSSIISQFSLTISSVIADKKLPWITHC